MADLEAEIARGRIDPVYVLVGDDELLVSRVVAALREATVPPAARAFNYDVFEAKGTSATAILNAARTLPMMGRRRMVLLREAETLGAEALADLVPYLDAPAPETVLVLQCGKVDARLKFFAAAKKKGFVHVLSAPRALGPWIQQEARRRGVRITPEAVNRLADVCGRDLSRVASALEQLELYVGEGRPIGAEDVDDLVAETRERTVFELAHAVGEGNRERALRAIANLFEQRESAVGVAMMLARHFRQLALARELVAARVPMQDLPARLGVPPFAAPALVAQARRLSPGAAARAFELLAEADLALKGPKKGALGERIVVERLAFDLMGLTERAETEAATPRR